MLRGQWANPPQDDTVTEVGQSQRRRSTVTPDSRGALSLHCSRG